MFGNAPSAIVTANGIVTVIRPSPLAGIASSSGRTRANASAASR